MGMSMTGIIRLCSNVARVLLLEDAKPARADEQDRPGNIAADISTIGRHAIPRKRIQAAIGAVMLNAATSTEAREAG